jgi:hypothetical protein
LLTKYASNGYPGKVVATGKAIVTVASPYDRRESQFDSMGEEYMPFPWSLIRIWSTRGEPVDLVAVGLIEKGLAPL